MQVMFTWEWFVMKTLFAVEDKEIHPKGIKGRHEDTRRDRKKRKTGARQMAGMHCFDDAVFGVEARKKWRTDRKSVV